MICELRDVVSKQQNTIQESHHQLQEYQRQMECVLADTKAQLSEESRQARDQINVLLVVTKHWKRVLSGVLVAGPTPKGRELSNLLYHFLLFTPV